MKNETTILLEKLAAQMGTTAEYLWAVLIRQAPISATVDLVLALIFLTITWLYVRFGIKKWQRIYDEDWGLGYAAGGIIVVILFFCAIISIPGIINGYMSPEYWALKEVLNTIQE